ncbi:hypothetical protein [Paenibacillus aestuarii]|uniref:Asp/Glu racemase n=1 Tax=Paenibacillus aestuarii TaxID=516965 RepID=A0ABW0K4S0_9BACL|nr:hypothetical protein [Paenibacillus aestuarii]
MLQSLKSLEIEGGGMMKKIGCYHAHYSNIEHIERALGHLDVELVHFVDPGLDRMKQDAGFSSEMAEKKVTETLDWIARCHVDAILVTCTFFTALIQPELHRYAIPVIKIDEPLLKQIGAAQEPLQVVFTNPATVEGTMKQWRDDLSKRGITVQMEPRLLEHTFELIMQGQKSAYTEAVAEGLVKLIAENPGKRIVAAQLSMVPAAKMAEAQTAHEVWNHLDGLIEYFQSD